MDQSQLNWITDFIWNIADDVLRDVFVRSKYRDVILPMTVLRRLDAVLEPRSNTMKMGIWKDDLADSLKTAEQIFCFTRDAYWAKEALISLAQQVTCCDDLQQLINGIAVIAKPGDHIVIMSNGGFGGIHEKILQVLQQ